MERVTSAVIAKKNSVLDYENSGSSAVRLSPSIFNNYSPKANNCFSIIFKCEHQKVQKTS